MSCGSCTGACCAVFEFSDPSGPSWGPNIAENSEEREFLADMLVSLTLVEAAERMEKYGVAYWSDTACHDWDGRSTLEGHEGRRLMTCRHWDEESGLCGVYDSRPRMCADYPYYASDCDYKCGFSLTFQQMWDRALRLGGAESGTPPNIIRSEN